MKLPLALSWPLSFTAAIGVGVLNHVATSVAAQETPTHGLRSTSGSPDNFTEASGFPTLQLADIFSRTLELMEKGSEKLLSKLPEHQSKEADVAALAMRRVEEDLKKLHLMAVKLQSRARTDFDRLHGDAAWQRELRAISDKRLETLENEKKHQEAVMDEEFQSSRRANAAYDQVLKLRQNLNESKAATAKLENKVQKCTEDQTMLESQLHVSRGFAQGLQKQLILAGKQKANLSSAVHATQVQMGLIRQNLSLAAEACKKRTSKLQEKQELIYDQLERTTGELWSARATVESLQKESLGHKQLIAKLQKELKDLSDEKDHQMDLSRSLLHENTELHAQLNAGQGSKMLTAATAAATSARPAQPASTAAAVVQPAEAAPTVAIPGVINSVDEESLVGKIDSLGKVAEAASTSNRTAKTLAKYTVAGARDAGKITPHQQAEASTQSTNQASTKSLRAKQAAIKTAVAPPEAADEAALRDLREADRLISSAMTD